MPSRFVSGRHAAIQSRLQDFTCSFYSLHVSTIPVLDLFGIGDFKLGEFWLYNVGDFVNGDDPSCPCRLKKQQCVRAALNGCCSSHTYRNEGGPL